MLFASEQSSSRVFSKKLAKLCRMTSVFKLQSNLKLQGEIDADDNARVRFQEVVAPEIEVPLFEGIV